MEAELILNMNDCIHPNYVAFSNGKIYSKKSNRFLKPISRGEYDYVTIGRKMVAIHRIIAKCFVANPENKPCVNHIDGNKRNNKAGNLEWCTYSENLIHAYRKGLNKRERKVVRIDDCGNEVVYRSAREAEKEGFANQLIAKCCKGNRKHHKGYRWRYAE